MKTKFEFFPKTKKKLIIIKFVEENEEDKHFLAIVKEKMNYGKFSSEISSSTMVGGECREMEFLFEAPSKK